MALCIENLMNLITIFEEVMFEGSRAVDVVYIFSRVFDKFLHGGLETQEGKLA